MQRMQEMELNRRYTLPSHNSDENAAEDLHAWSIYRQNLNSDFTDSALGSDERSPLPYGNFQLREQTVQSILRHPRLAPRSELGSNMYAYLKFGLPRVFPIKRDDDGATVVHGEGRARSEVDLRARSELDLRDGYIKERFKVSASESGHPEHHHHLQHHNHHNHHNHQRATLENRVGSQISLVSRSSRRPYHKGTLSEGDSPDLLYEYPHLQIRNLTVENGKSRVIDGVTFDLHGGELLAIMATNAMEGTTLLTTLSGRTKASKARAKGDIVLNGNPVTLQRLGSRVAFVRRDYRLHPDITVYQTMRFHSLLRSSAPTSANVLLEELGLSSVKKSFVSALTSAERQRLSVACQLMMDTDVVLLDQPTRGMDIFDTFFLVDYLRQWSMSRGKIVLMTIHPPTFEIFSMFSKVALMSTGRLMFYGHRKEMLPYFAFIEYPCPAFKNPSDYYLDLVTLDDLSSEALLESSQRIETLADSYRRKMEPLSDPGPPQPLPPRIKPPGFFRQFYAICMQCLVYTFPWNVIGWLLRVLMAATISIILGAIFWNIRLTSNQDQNNLSDRVGLIWTIMCLTSWPIVLIVNFRDEKSLDYVTRDFEEFLYSKATYYLVKSLIELPLILTVYLAYFIPAYVMAGVTDTDIYPFYFFVGTQLIYMQTKQVLTNALRPLQMLHIPLTLTLALPIMLPTLLHPKDLAPYIYWIKYVSNIFWLLQPTLKSELQTIDTLTCPKNPVVQENNIVVQVDCNIHNTETALLYFDVESWPFWVSVCSAVAVATVGAAIGFFGFILSRSGKALPPVEKP